MADYKVRLVTGRYCLAETKNNWIVGCGYNPDRPEGQQWEQGKYFFKANGLIGLLSYTKQRSICIVVWTKTTFQEKG